MGGVHWLVFLPAAALASLVPGANQLLSLRNAVRQGTADATVALLGRFGAFALLAGAVAAGFGVVLTRSATAFAVVRWAGVAYLTWLGVTLLWRSFRGGPGGRDAVVDPRGRWWLVRQEFLVAVTNPKALLLFAAFLPQFVSAPTPAALGLVGAAYIGVEAVSALCYTVLGGRLARLELTGRTQARLDRVSGVSFLGLGGWLALEPRP